MSKRTPSVVVVKSPSKKSPSVWRWVKWAAIGLGGTVFVVVVLILILLFHTAAPPVVRVDPIAAERLEAEMRLAQSGAASEASRVVHQLELTLAEIERKSGRTSTLSGAPHSVQTVPVV